MIMIIILKIISTNFLTESIEQILIVVIFVLMFYYQMAFNRFILFLLLNVDEVVVSLIILFKIAFYENNENF